MFHEIMEVTDEVPLKNTTLIYPPDYDLVHRSEQPIISTPALKCCPIPSSLHPESPIY